jgi:AraC-like DNA-binding protein
MKHAPLIVPSVSVRRYDAVEASDVHDFHQIVLGLDGEMAMAVEGREQRIDCHGAWIIPAGARHEYWAAGENRQLVLDLPFSSVAVPERFFERARAIGIDSQVTRLVQGVAMGVKAHDTALANRFAWQAATHLCGALISDARLDEARGLDFARIDRWLRAQLSEPLRVADLAAHCGFGMRRFHQLFNEAFGETPHRYLNRETLSDIALTVGFADQSAFTHAFTKRFGMAPGQWRSGRH